MKKKLFNLTEGVLNSDKKQITAKIEKISKQDVAIIGMAAQLPGAENISEFWELLKNGADFIRPLPQIRKQDIQAYHQFQKVDTDKYDFIQAAYLSEIDKFDHSFFNISYKEACLMSPQQRIFLETLWHSIEDAGYLGNKINNTKTGVFIGASQESEYINWVEETSPEFHMMAIPGNIPAITASRISYLLDLKGPSLLVDTSCSSSLVAIHLACQSLKNQECEMAIAGGINIILDPTYKKNRQKPVISSSSGRARTFDESADGTGSGEGSISFILKPLDKAIRDGDNIHAVIKGSAINQDGSSIGITAPNVLAQRDVIIQAWESAKISPTTIGYWEAHGTGTKLGDPIEIQGITEAYKPYTDQKQFCPIGAVKANVGHLDSTAGAMGLLKSILVLKYKQIPPLAHFQEPNREISFIESPVYINQDLMEWYKTEGYPRRCGISSFGLSGTNCHLVLEEAPHINKPIISKQKIEVLCLSAKTESALKQLVKRYHRFLQTVHSDQLENICYTSNTGRGHFSYRLAIVGTDLADFANKLDIVSNNDLQSFSQNDIYYSYFQTVSANRQDPAENQFTEKQLQENNNKTNSKIEEELGKTEVVSSDFVRELAKDYVSGVDVDWKKLYRLEERRIVSIPLYPFEKKRCWLDIPIKQEEQIVTTNKETIKDHLKQFISHSFEVEIKDGEEDADFYEFGIDSISIFQLKQEILDKYQVEITPEKLFASINTINKLVEYLEDVVQPEMMLPSESEEKTEQLIQPGNLTDYKSKSSVHSESVLETRSPDMANRILQESFTEQSTELIIKQQLEIMSMQLRILEKEKKTIGKHSERIELPTQMNFEITREHAPTPQPNRLLRRFIVKEDQTLNQQQVEKFKDLMKDYMEKTVKSKCLTASYRSVWSNDRFNQGYTEQWKDLVYPILVEKAKGSRIWDVDGNEYIDFSMGFGSILLGYNHPIIAQKVKEASEEGLIIGPVSPYAAEVASLVSELTGTERVAFYNSGTEAVMVAVRIARATTKKNKIVLFTGSFHGTFDSVNAQKDFTTKQMKSVPVSLGTPFNLVEDVIVLEYGKHEDLDVIKQFGDEIAAVLIEPVQSRRPQLQPREFLHKLREITTDYEIALIFDEVVTGFRLDPRGAQAFYGVEADILCYGKIAGGGMPIGIVAGKAKFIDRIDGGNWNYDGNSNPSSEVIVSGGTFCCHPLSMAASRAVLTYIKANKDTLYEGISRRTAFLASNLNDFFEKYQIPIEIAHCGSIFTFKPKRDVVFLRFLFYKLAEKGVYLWEGATCFVSVAHSDEDIEYFVKAVQECCFEMAATGIFSVSPFELDQKKNMMIPLTEEQVRMWILSSQSPKNSIAYNEPIIIPLKGNLQINLMKESIQELINRHESLRITKISDMHMHVSDKVDSDIPFVSFTEVANEGREQAVMKWIEEIVEQPFDLSEGELFKPYILHLDEESHVLFFLKHHIAVDGWSENVLIEELLTLYTEKLSGKPSTLGQAIQFSDYVKWCNNQYEINREANEFWKKEFAMSYPPLQFNTDLIRNEDGDETEGGHLSIQLDNVLLTKLKTLSKNLKASLFMTLLSAYYVFLYRLTYEEKLQVGIPFSGQLKMEANQLVGHCVSMLPLQVTIDEEISIAEFVKVIKEKFLEVSKYQIFSTKQVIEELDQENVDYFVSETNVAFNMDRSFAAVYSNYEIVPDLVMDQQFKLEKAPQSKYDLFLDILESEDKLYIRFEYNKSKFSDELIKIWTGYYMAMLEQITTNPEAFLYEIELEI
ncbi:aminotransferase class III-fold pyridoxal phosphate-dependent enzyme [Brevibacillus laterosporus]|uniref:Uncharacterized protein n=1 Tax=Brevibacillus laterosporus TaxID=1465 RepID=A0A0F7EJY6_BRELA|nr:aminotransferase class III-fold pyridoxal phosphate-dependent enzyme [Brevibacillus laterosporus]AKF95948.1 hypothetical protein EX87_20435 [Brevibacillus laterosporus]